MHSTDKIKVIYVVTSLQLAGAEKLTVDLACRLNKNKFTAGIASTSNVADYSLIKRLKDNDVAVWRNEKRSGFSPGKACFVDRVINEFRPHIVHSNISGLVFSGPSSFLRKIPVKVHTIHNPFDKDTGRLIHILYCVYFMLGVKPIAVSEDVRKSVNRFFPACEVKYISNGVDTSFYSPDYGRRRSWRSKEGFDENDLIIVSVGRLVAQKNNILLLRAFAGIIDKIPSAKLILAGDGELRSALQSEAVREGIADKVYFLGVRADIQDILAASDIFVQASFYEGMSLSVLEAISSGLPVVGSSVGGISELVENGVNGALFSPGDQQGLSNAVVDIAMDSAARIKMGKNSRDAASAYDIDTTIKEYEAYYSSSMDNYRSKRYVR